jgi:hypothetical protein
MDGHVAEMVARRKEALALLKAARAGSDRRLVRQYEKIVREWNALLAPHGVGPEE